MPATIYRNLFDQWLHHVDAGAVVAAAAAAAEDDAFCRIGTGLWTGDIAQGLVMPRDRQISG